MTRPQAEINLSNGLFYFRDSTPLYIKEFIAGGIAGASSRASIAPFERIKILFQTRVGIYQSLGIWRSLGHVYNTEGVWGLYRGNGAAIMRAAPYAALHFMTYERYHDCLEDRFPSAGAFMAGSLAGATSTICTYPLDLARTRLAYQVPGGQVVYNDIGHVLKSAYSQGGVRGLYRGLCPTLYGILPYSGLKFFLFERLKASLSPDEENYVLGTLISGALAGLISQTVIYPLDVVRRQMQVQETNAFKGTLSALAHVIRKQGWRQMFSGVTINYVRIVPSTAIGFAVYDAMKIVLGVQPRVKSQIE